MGCVRTSLGTARLKKKYPLVRNIPKTVYVTDVNAEIENLLLEISNDDVITVTFSTPFSGTPNVVASFISTSTVGAVNVFVETASKTAATIRTSAPATGLISIQAMYIESCPIQDYT